MNDLTIPGTCTKIHDGTIVMLAKFPGTKWIVHNGWYTYQGKQYLGWYFCSIPAQVILPLNDEDLYMITIVSPDGCCPDPYPPYPPCPPGPVPPDIIMQSRRAWISVETIAQRDELNKQLVPNGKIVRVNNVSGHPEYYRWNQVDQIWEPETFGIDVTNLVTSDDVKSIIKEETSSDEFVTNMSNQLFTNETYNQSLNDTIDSKLQWNPIK